MKDLILGMVGGKRDLFVRAGFGRLGKMEWGQTILDTPHRLAFKKRWQIVRNPTHGLGNGDMSFKIEKVR